ncbi:hypothetical protein AM501_04310 [Aneurinibacillus migulanus]|uniref:hypothetical protein n=1 Tax=Aneurinibacillus migulanus TaxID=47500 RepID=UPI0005BD9361|nr:hypothetical protein [Aneurinibacillus migulanus]KIV55028.1 hypothetical protein TS64_12160 [Aneurinibacillus migulanus]KPD09427.1 hypothetical protein AM501_04310 [Aneurinibacillus migulanus]
MRSFYDHGRTLIPRERMDRNEPGEVITYQLSTEELAKYRALPVVKHKRPMTIPERRKKA